MKEKIYILEIFIKIKTFLNLRIIRLHLLVVILGCFCVLATA